MICPKTSNNLKLSCWIYKKHSNNSLSKLCYLMFSLLYLLLKSLFFQSWVSTTNHRNPVMSNPDYQALPSLISLFSLPLLYHSVLFSLNYVFCSFKWHTKWNNLCHIVLCGQIVLSVTLKTQQRERETDRERNGEKELSLWICLFRGSSTVVSLAWSHTHRSAECVGVQTEGRYLHGVLEDSR